MVEPDLVLARLREAFPEAEKIELKDLTGTKDHYQALIVSNVFAGKPRVAQHQLVYAALGELMAGPVHALALRTCTPEAWASK
ncbi:MAG: BolA family transcriptional regulator [Proteobacteria bacterium]|nr:BolA family transcriptional regulator [Pseudomonadota bacterium]